MFEPSLRWQDPFGENKRNEQAREQNLGYKCERLRSDRRRGDGHWLGGGQIEEGVVRGKVVAVVQASDVV